MITKIRNIAFILNCTFAQFGFYVMFMENVIWMTIDEENAEIPYKMETGKCN